MSINRGPQSCEVLWIALTVVQPLTRNSNNGSLWAKYAGDVCLYMETLWGISFHICLSSSAVSRGCFSSWSSNVVQRFLEMNLKSELLRFCRVWHASPLQTIPCSLHSRLVLVFLPGLINIKQDERVSTGIDGNLYFSHAFKNDSREDYCCFASFTTIRTIVHKPATAMLVEGCRFAWLCALPKIRNTKELLFFFVNEDRYL